MTLFDLTTAIPIFAILCLLLAHEVTDFCKEWREIKWEE